MGVGGPLDVQKTRIVLDMFKAHQHQEIDTAVLYQGGKTERVLGEAGLGGLTVATKVNPWFDVNRGVSTDSPCKGLAPEAVRKQIQKSLAALGAKKVDLLYLHAPDHDTPIEDTLQTIHELHQSEVFEEWGLSNFASWQVVHIYHLCKANNWKPPTVYQGMYNCLTRNVEKELFPALRLCGMRFYAYNPLAGGILTGKYQLKDNPQEGRFSGKTVWGVKYRERFWKDEIFEAVEKIKSQGEAHKITPIEAAMSWMYFHSALKGELGDGVIIGGSSVDQIKENLGVIQNLKPLPADLLETIEQAWIQAQPNCPQYFR
eukprot:TRINITY_DN5611_c0_g1_i1.p1 TRINITY_DN5611_c0_g1~~TRINITY_DN5611_c0_g1_i1.p1  ORF type:complete len:326 (+),score=65.31 TRINITY_DN5611_c0_g1_i1:33-980(+)